jgi:PAS domain S-box-containing protein
MPQEKKPRSKRRGSEIEQEVAAARQREQRHIAAEEQLQSGLDYAQGIIDTVREPLLVLDDTLRVRTANRSFCRVFEVDRVNTEGRLVYELGNGQWNIPKLRLLLQEILAENRALDDFEVDHDFPHLGRRVMLLNARKVWREGNHSASILLAIEDVTERYNAESERRKAAELTQRLLDSSPDCIKILDLDAKLVSMSENGMRALCITDLTPHIGTDWLGYWKGADREAAAVALRKATSGQTGTFEGYFATPAGEPRWWHVAVSPVLDERNQPQLLLAVSRDITERKRMEEALELANKKLESSARELTRSNEDLEQFARVAAHDLRAPLRTIVQFSQLLVRRYKDLEDEHTQEYLQFIEQGGQRMAALIDDLMRYALVAQTPLIPDIVQAASACDTAVTNLTAAIESHAAKVHCLIPEQVKVKVEISLLTQVFQNLIANGIHYRRDDIAPDIKVRAQTQGVHWLFSVEDNGIGIEKHNAEKIFEPFRRLHGTDRPGSGIGLATCKRVIERAEGKIWVDSRPDQGSTFFFLLPKA